MVCAESVAVTTVKKLDKQGVTGKSIDPTRVPTSKKNTAVRSSSLSISLYARYLAGTFETSFYTLYEWKCSEHDIPLTAWCGHLRIVCER
jgi:hypothetical protein